MMKQTWISLLAGVLLAHWTQAEIPRAHIPAAAKWVVDIKVDQFKKTDLGKFFLGQMAKNSSGLAELKKELQFDPHTDLDRITMFGFSKEPDESIVLIKGKFKHDHLQAKLKQNEKYEARKAGSHTFHSWVDDAKRGGGPSHGCFYAKNIVLMGGNGNLLETAVKVLDGKAASLKTQPGLPHPPLPKRPTFITIAANLDELEEGGDGPGAAVLQNVQTLAFAAGQVQQNLWAQVGIIPDNAEAGKKIRDTLAGFLALAGLAEAEDPRMQQITQLVKATKVEFKNGHVILSLDFPMAKLLDTLKAEQ